MFGSKHTTKELTKLAANSKKKASSRNTIAIVSTAVMLSIMAGNMIFAEDNSAIKKLESIFDSLFTELYGAIVAVSTIIAVAMVAVCLIIRMLSKNQRSVDEATQWIKRILITWVILNGLMLFYDLAKQIADGMGGTYH